jgi:hypothetical protein
MDNFLLLSLCTEIDVLLDELVVVQRLMYFVDTISAKYFTDGARPDHINIDQIALLIT